MTGIYEYASRIRTSIFLQEFFLEPRLYHNIG